MPFPQAGEQAPGFTSTTAEGDPIALSDYQGQTVVLYFYPKADTPGCTKQACLFRDNYGAFEDRNVVVIGVSPDTVEDQKAFKDKFNLPFTLVADADHSVSEIYGTWDNHEITTRSGKTRSYTGTYRSTLVIDGEGKVVDSRWGVDPANDTQEVLDLLDDLSL